MTTSPEVSDVSFSASPLTCEATERYCRILTSRAEVGSELSVNGDAPRRRPTIEHGAARNRLQDESDFRPGANQSGRGVAA
jgi:hypothetical protein